jgi:hypothetical protein
LFGEDPLVVGYRFEMTPCGEAGVGMCGDCGDIVGEGSAE